MKRLLPIKQVKDRFLIGLPHVPIPIRHRQLVKIRQQRRGAAAGWIMWNWLHSDWRSLVDHLRIQVHQMSLIFDSENDNRGFLRPSQWGSGATESAGQYMAEERKR